MEDREIVDLYWARDEAAIRETSQKYGRYCHYIAYHILHTREDSEECVNDAYMSAWAAMPDQRPERLGVFLGKLTRNLALNRRKKDAAKKRGSGQIALVIEELQDGIPLADDSEKLIDDLAFAEIMNRFLASLSQEARRIFMRRYWYFSSVREISKAYGIGESKVKMSLMRSRNELRKMLEQEGIL